MAAARAICRALPRCRAVVGGNSRASSSEAGKGRWERLMKEPAKTETSSHKWDFLHELDATHVKRPQTRFPSPSTSSYRKLADSGLDFLAEGHSTSPKEPASEQSESGVKELLKTASFKLLKDSFEKTPSDTEKKVVGEAIGMDSSPFFSSTEHWSKDRTLAEVEAGNFYTTVDNSSLDFKIYTYEELGEKLRTARPPKEQILSSATGLSFGELRTRIEKIEPKKDGPKQEYQELKESLKVLRNFRQDTRGQLSYEELAFVNSHGVRPISQRRIEYIPPNDDLLTKYYSETQLSSKERLKLRIKKLKEEFQSHEYDTGSPQVQIAILTARINNLNRHMREGPNYKRDKHSKKGLNGMVQYRKRLLRYLRRRDWPVYCNVLTKLNLDDVILEKRH